ncbi:MAG TPA: ferredoxin:CoB-CoM heterodisulfide reductase subunit HdrA [Methanosarcina sp.]|nr:ferredoxin:CoB-CoM heterodisulfide reductase subunit HdrA [Methanosarcina sp.]
MNIAFDKTAVFICHCSGNISDRIDINLIKKTLKAEGIPVFDYEYLCSSEGQTLIKNKVSEGKFDRIVIGSCTPSKHGTLFKKCIKEAGLNRAMLEIANLREHCSWVHPDKTEATEKALSLLFGKIKRLENVKPLEEIKVDIAPQALVIGGGIAGITAAINLADNGIFTYLVEKDSSIGGNMAKIGKVFSPDKLAEECSMCSLSPLMNEVIENPRIKLLTWTEVERLSGSAGNFTIRLRKKPRYVNDNCTGCGRCSHVCPVFVENEFNCGYIDKKAISLRFSQSVPKIYCIDPDYCLKLNGEACEKCIDACKSGAIDFSQKEEIIELNVGAVVVATGFEEYRASEKPQYGYGIFENVITQMELARMLGINGPTKGVVLRPSDISKVSDSIKALTGTCSSENSSDDFSDNSSEVKTPKRIVMIQCVGSRDEKEGGNRYCSKYCCMAALKHSSLVVKKYPDTEITICYVDLRALGFYENYYRVVQDIGVHFVRGRPAEIVEKPDKSLVVRIEDTLEQKIKEIPADLVVLSAAMVPSKGTRKIASILNLNQDESGFIKERHSKLRPVDSSLDGIFVCGTAQSPKDVTDTISQAGLAAVRARAFITDSPKALANEIPSINPLLCTKCEECLKCPFGALSLNDSGRIVVDPLICTGCGYCTELCQSGAVQITGFTKNQLKAEIEGVLKEGDLLGFVNCGIASLTCDNIGNSVITYPSNVKLIKVPTSLVLDKEILLHAFKHGAGSIIFIEDPPDSPKAEIIYPLTVNHFEKLKEELVDSGNRLHFKKAYVPNTQGLAGTFTSLAREGEMIK